MRKNKTDHRGAKGMRESASGYVMNTRDGPVMGGNVRGICMYVCVYVCVCLSLSPSIPLTRRCHFLHCGSGTVSHKPKHGEHHKTSQDGGETVEQRHHQGVTLAPVPKLIVGAE